MKQKVCAFDFDGTLTTRDTLIEFIRYARGNARFLWGFMLFSPLLVLMKLHLYPNYKAKKKVFSYFFKGEKIADFDDICGHFADDKRDLLRQKGKAEIAKALKDNAKVLIVSASIDNWVMPFFNMDASHIDANILVLGTKIEVVDGKITGRFLTPNCYGQEKVNRIKEVMPERDSYELIVFGDSRGDKEMLEYADRGYYKPFR